MGQLSSSPKADSEAASSWSFHPDHQAAVDRQRRIIVQYDAMGNGPPTDMDVHEWRAFGFQHFDQPNSQVDAIWWDCSELNGAMYFTGVLPYPGTSKTSPEVEWRPTPAGAGTDWLAIYVEETHRRGFEAFWNHRISNVEIDVDGLDMHRLNPIKAEHPDWVIKTWWWQGMWNLAVPEVRDFSVAQIQALVERYDFDGYQIDFSRHTPVLPVGRQWELRDSVTGLMRQVREMLLEASAAKNRPVLLSAKVPRSLENCRIDGFDVVRWVQEGLVDMLTLGSRSYDVDIEGYRAALGPSVKLYPCLDDHHASDAYQFPPVELFRGVASSWWRQGADGIVTFNWSNAPPEVLVAMGHRPSPESQPTAYREIGSVETLDGKSKVFPVERRGGYPWGEGASGQNLHAQLPLKLAYDGRPSDVTLYCTEDLSEAPKGVRDVSLRLTVFGSEPGDRLEGEAERQAVGRGRLRLRLERPEDLLSFAAAECGQLWLPGDRPKQKLLLVTHDLNPNDVRLGDNIVAISVTHQAPHTLRKLQVEKVELHVTYGG